MVSRVRALLPCVCVCVCVCGSPSLFLLLLGHGFPVGVRGWARPSATAGANPDSLDQSWPINLPEATPRESCYSNRFISFFCNLCASRCAFMWVPDTSFCFSLTQTCINPQLQLSPCCVQDYTHHLRILKAFLRWLPLPRFRSGDELNLP